MSDGKQGIVWACETLMFVRTRINASSKEVSCFFWILVRACVATQAPSETDAFESQKKSPLYRGLLNQRRTRGAYWSRLKTACG